MKCYRCGKRIDEGTRLCPYCGANQRRYNDDYDYDIPDYPRKRKKGFPVLLVIILILLILAAGFVCYKIFWPGISARLGIGGRTPAATVAETVVETAAPGDETTLYVMEDGSLVSTTPTPSPSPTPTPVPTPSPTPEPPEEVGYPPESVKTEIEQASLDVRPAAEEFVSEQTVRYVNTSSGPLNYRRGPATTYGTVGQLPKGESLSVYAIKDGWALVKYGTAWGWCSVDYLSETKP